MLRRGVAPGISLARLRTGVVTVRARQGGERLRLDDRRPNRSLKNLLQEARVAPWLRERLPLVYCDDVLVWAAGIGIDCEFRARGREAALVPEWSQAQ
jgi:tRNA(Ile)-lysidine synthase